MSRPHRPWTVSNRSFLCWSCRTRVRASTFRHVYPGETVTCACGATLRSPFGVSTAAPKKARKGRWKKLHKRVAARRMEEHDSAAHRGVATEILRRDFFKKPASKPRR
jgi:hypothetical protein